MTITFALDVNKDYCNYATSMYDEKYKSVVPSSAFKSENLMDFVYKRWEREKAYLKEKVIVFSDAWRKVEKRVFDRIFKITGKPLKGNFTVYLTTIKKCPYDTIDNSIWMYYLFDNDRLVRGMIHELLHFHFHEYYYDNIKKLKGEIFAHQVKEAMDFLINEEFNDIAKPINRKQSDFAELSDKFLAIWKSKKKQDFDEFVIKCVEVAELT